MNELVTILGPTACGKTNLACQLAYDCQGAVISADSRQVYQGLDIGTGKDLDEYRVENYQIPYYLIDVAPPTVEYNVFLYQKDFLKAYQDLKSRKLVPILCGGSGMYLQAVLDGYQLLKVPENKELRMTLQNKSHQELVQLLKSVRKIHNTTDIEDHDRLIRAVEIATYENQHPELVQPFPAFNHYIFGIKTDRSQLKDRITKRLKNRLDNGMVSEVEGLLKAGVSTEKLKFFGLEYRYITLYLEGDLNFNDMYQKLNAAIHNFAKRQMTWFRRMERQGWQIHWLDADKRVEENVTEIRQFLKLTDR